MTPECICKYGGRKTTKDEKKKKHRKGGEGGAASFDPTTHFVRSFVRSFARSFLSLVETIFLKSFLFSARTTS
jgi:hypothetical protein